MFPEIKKNFGFGCMRLPTNKFKMIDYKELDKMVDAFIGAGFNYFDTAHGYLSGKSEIALRECLTSRHAPRRPGFPWRSKPYSFLTKEKVEYSWMDIASIPSGVKSAIAFK